MALYGFKIECGDCDDVEGVQLFGSGTRWIPLLGLNDSCPAQGISVRPLKIYFAIALLFLVYYISTTMTYMMIYVILYTIYYDM